MHRACFFSLAGLVWAILSVAGCGASSERFAIVGTVTLDGQPIPTGSIAFRPLESTRSPSAGAEIVDGRFSISDDKGVRPGKFRVEILATRKTGKKFNDPVFGPSEVEEQYMPVQFNSRSELMAEVSGTNQSELNFDLKSK